MFQEKENRKHTVNDYLHEYTYLMAPIYIQINEDSILRVNTFLTDIEKMAYNKNQATNTQECNWESSIKLYGISCAIISVN